MCCKGHEFYFPTVGPLYHRRVVWWILSAHVTPVPTSHSDIPAKNLVSLWKARQGGLTRSISHHPTAQARDIMKCVFLPFPSLKGADLVPVSVPYLDCPKHSTSTYDWCSFVMHWGCVHHNFKCIWTWASRQKYEFKCQGLTQPEYELQDGNKEFVVFACFILGSAGDQTHDCMGLSINPGPRMCLTVSPSESECELKDWSVRISVSPRILKQVSVSIRVAEYIWVWVSGLKGIWNMCSVPYESRCENWAPFLSLSVSFTVPMWVWMWGS
jgi:hypothetical protein